MNQILTMLRSVCMIAYTFFIDFLIDIKLIR